MDEDVNVTSLLHMESKQNTHARQSIEAGNPGRIDGIRWDSTGFDGIHRSNKWSELCLGLSKDRVFIWRWAWQS